MSVIAVKMEFNDEAILKYTCRACMTESRKRNMYPLTDSTTRDLYIDCSSLEVSESDGLPAMLCPECYEQCRSFIAFRNMCAETEINLRKMLYPKAEFEKADAESYYEYEMNDDNVVEDNENHYSGSPAETTAEDKDIESIPEYDEPADDGITFCCAVCNEQFNSVALARLHSHKESPPAAVQLPREYICEICGKVFQDSTKFRNHKAGHTIVHRFQCDQCPVKFTRRAHLIAHQYKHNAPNSKDFACEECPGKFRTASDRRSHMRRVHSGILFPCTECDRSFKSRVVLKRHMRIHTGERPFECDICHQTFTRKFNLKHHLMIHTEKKPYQCHICSMSFRMRTHMITHQKVHSKL